MGLKDFRWESRFLWKNGDKIGASEIKGKKHQKGKMTFFSRKGKQRGKFHFIWIRSHKEDDKLYEWKN